MATEIENKIILGDCIEVMKTLPDNSVDVACTCYDNKTELLTENGFKLFKNLKKGELVATLNLKTNTLEYQKVQTTQKNKYNGIMYNIKTPSIDLLVTPNHNMVSRRYCRNNTNNLFSLNKIEQIVENKEKVELKKDCIWKGKYKKYFYLPAQEYNNKCHRSRTGEFTRKLKPIKIDMNIWLSFFGYFISEGATCVSKSYNRKHSSTYTTGNNVSLYQNTGTKVEKNMIEVCKKLPFNFQIKHRKRKDSNPSTEIRFNNKQLLLYLQQFGRSYEKYIPKEILQLPAIQLKYLFTTLMEGDGAKDLHAYSTSSKKLADIFIEILMKIGYNGTIKAQKPIDTYIRGKLIKKENCKTHYIISINRMKLTPIVLQNSYKKKKYNNYIYCCSVPNRTLFVRRNGKSLWCGNSPPYNLKHLVRYDKKKDKYYHQKVYTEYKDEADDYFNLLDKSIEQLLRVTKHNVFFNIQMLLGNKLDIINILHKYQKNLKDVIVWHKTSAQPSINKTQLSSGFEFIFVFSNEENCKSKPFNYAFFNNRKKGEKNTNVIMGGSGSGDRVKLGSDAKNFAFFPEYLPEWIIKRFTKEGDLVLDCFSGLGTTAVVAKKLGRKYLGIEMDKTYVEFSEKRLKNTQAFKNWW